MDNSVIPGQIDSDDYEGICLHDGDVEFLILSDGIGLPASSVADWKRNAGT